MATEAAGRITDSRGVLTGRASAPRDIGKEPEKTGLSPRSAIAYGVRSGQPVEVAESSLVLRARVLTWPRESAATSLAARPCVSPFGKLILPCPPAPAAFSVDPSPYLSETAMTPRKQKNYRQHP